MNNESLLPIHLPIKLMLSHDKNNNQWISATSASKKTNRPSRNKSLVLQRKRMKAKLRKRTLAGIDDLQY